MTIQDNLRRVTDEIAASSQGRIPRLVAVSKRQTVDDIRMAYDAGQRVFGENYIHELVEKYDKLPTDITWHYIGALQSNKLKALTAIPNLVIETVDGERRAEQLHRYVVEGRRLPIFIQVNTSGEGQKNGITPEQAPGLVRMVIESCPRLQFIGLMMIGSVEESDREINRDFERLLECREDVANVLGISIDEIELSMGMSTDYIQAVKRGSTNVRVGRAIFGDRRTE